MARWTASAASASAQGSLILPVGEPPGTDRRELSWRAGAQCGRAVCIVWRTDRRRLSGDSCVLPSVSPHEHRALSWRIGAGPADAAGGAGRAVHTAAFGSRSPLLDGRRLHDCATGVVHELTSSDGRGQFRTPGTADRWTMLS